MKKERIDLLLVEKGFFSSREQAAAALMAGRILVNERKIDKSGTKVDTEAFIRITGENMPYVSRGGLKLEKALCEFNISLKDKIVADIGASTGGFTDCALQNGAQKVYAVDVGYGQLAWKLRTDSRVINMERTNARHLPQGSFTEQIDVMTIDLAFISLELVFPVLVELLAEDGQIIALVKPQFEAGRDNVGKKGVVRNPVIHKDVLEKIVTSAQNNGLIPLGLTYSPIRGPEGNIEYLLYLGQANAVNHPFEYYIPAIVDAAHEKTK